MFLMLPSFLRKQWTHEIELLVIQLTFFFSLFWINIKYMFTSFQKHVRHNNVYAWILAGTSKIWAVRKHMWIHLLGNWYKWGLWVIYFLMQSRLSQFTNKVVKESWFGSIVISYRFTQMSKSKLWTTKEMVIFFRYIVAPSMYCLLGERYWFLRYFVRCMFYLYAGVQRPNCAFNAWWIFLLFWWM